MANTRKSSKRAKQAVVRQARNTVVRSATKSALRNALDAFKAKDLGAAKEAFKQAIRAVSKAASKGAIPKPRAARKIARLTRLVKKINPAVMTSSK